MPKLYGKPFELTEANGSIQVSVFGRKPKKVANMAEAHDYILKARWPKSKVSSPALSSSRFTGGIVPKAVRVANGG